MGKKDGQERTNRYFEDEENPHQFHTPPPKPTARICKRLLGESGCLSEGAKCTPDPGDGQQLV